MSPLVVMQNTQPQARVRQDVPHEETARQDWLAGRSSTSSNGQKRHLRVLYTNVDQLVNKSDDLIMQNARNEPDIIMITEVIPEAQIIPLSPALLEIPMYRLYCTLTSTSLKLA